MMLKRGADAGHSLCTMNFRKEFEENVIDDFTGNTWKAERRTRVLPVIGM